MSIKVMSQVYDSDLTDIYEVSVMLALANHADDAGRCYPSIARIARLSRMGERGVQNVVKRLAARGYLSVKTGGGRGGTNIYIVIPNPAPCAPIPERETPHPIHPAPCAPRTPRQKTPHPTTLNPAPGAPETSVTINEPSKSNERDEVRLPLERWASSEAVSSFIDYRRKNKGAALTKTAAVRLANNLEQIFNDGGDADDALGLAEERGWKSVQPEWYFNAIGKKNGKPTRKSQSRMEAFIAGARGSQ